MEKLFNNICAMSVVLVALFVPVFLVSGLLSNIGFHWVAITAAWVVLFLVIPIVAYKMDWWRFSPEREGPCQQCQMEGNTGTAGGVEYCLTCGKMHI